MNSRMEGPELCCGFRLDEHLPLPMIMLQGWFSDQHDCFSLFIRELSPEEQSQLFGEKTVLDAVKSKYKRLGDDGTLRKNATTNGGEHKLPDQLAYSSFCYWAACVSKAVRKAAGLEILIRNLQSVEEAHDRFKPWFYKTRKVRNLNAADAARLLARYEYLEPEARPLLARGALRGAAILLNHEPPRKKIGVLEQEYQDLGKRIALEERAARYIDDRPELARSGRWRMEKGETWFCNVVHKVWYPS